MGKPEERSSPCDGRGHQICDYSDMDYVAFWQDFDRKYEDAAERIALRKLCRDMGGSCLEIGAGYGRLLNEYAQQCSRVLLTDYAQPLLELARQRIQKLGYDHVGCRQLNLYELECLEENFDNALCVRVLHHVENVPDFFTQVNRVLREGGVFVFEYANKRNLREMLRYLRKRENIGPFDHAPSKRGSGVYYNFHPAYIREALERSGFVVEEELAVSLFRSQLLKRLMGQRLLACLERLLQRPLGRLHPSPSVFVKARKVSGGEKRREDHEGKNLGGG